MSTEPNQPNFPSQSLRHIRECRCLDSLHLVKGLSSSIPVEISRAMSQPADPWVKIHIYCSMPLSFWGFLLHSIFVAIDNWYTEVLSNRYLRFIEFTMPKISLETVKLKFSLESHSNMLQNFWGENINLECSLNIILPYWASKHRFWKSFNPPSFLSSETNRYMCKARKTVWKKGKNLHVRLFETEQWGQLCLQTQLYFSWDSHSRSS